MTKEEKRKKRQEEIDKHNRLCLVRYMNSLGITDYDKLPFEIN